MLALFSPSVVPLVTKSGQNADSNVSGINTYRDLPGQSNPSSLNNTADYKDTTSAESTQYQYFQDSLTCCCLFNLPPQQAIKEFEDEFKKSPPPNYFRQWRNCWDEYDITPAMVRAWLEECDRLGWSERLGIVNAQPIEGGAA